MLLRAEVVPIAEYVELKIVDVSRTGFAGETSAALRAAQPVLFSVTPDRFHEGIVRWVRGHRFGADLADATDLLDAAQDIDPGLLPSHVARARRQPVDWIGIIAVGHVCHRTIVRDVSRSGLRLELEARLDVGQNVLVRLPDRPLVLATVRWCADRMVGLQTAERMQTLRLAYTSE
ncbi:PilZ domain-containing protein [Sphingomonas yunnanensis]|uniref:PilZ domain-containing protein n=1 Tax=Sphingomonas yunnanensis TaxID=310400 RepID=UPI001CA62A6E|nr:PilZ domain-containing protein [Sphingomonas yunnanensis]